MLLTLGQANEAYDLQSKLTADDANLFGKAIRGEENAIGDFVVRALTCETLDIDRLNNLMTASDWIVENHPLAAELRSINQPL